MPKAYKLICVVGARPNFMKIAPIVRALEPTPIRPFLLHTGQHYDSGLSRTFFEQLEIDTPDVNLEVGSASHAVQTAEIMKRFEPILEEQRPDAILVVGDVNSTIACALVAAKKSIRVVHVEAGLRSGDRSMPEEINRVLTDAISDLLFVTERSGVENLIREGIDKARIRFVGNVMIDTLLRYKERAPSYVHVLEAAADIQHAPAAGEYAVLTLHRPSNVDDPRKLAALLKTLARACRGIPVVFPVHPRTAARIREANMSGLVRPPDFVELPPVGYLEMIGLLKDAKFVVTDSGGLQEETTALGVPCMTLRENTERPVTIEQGTNVLMGTDPARIESAIADMLRTPGKRGRRPELWDGRAAERIAADLVSFLSGVRLP